MNDNIASIISQVMNRALLGLSSVIHIPSRKEGIHMEVTVSYSDDYKVIIHVYSMGCEFTYDSSKFYHMKGESEESEAIRRGLMIWHNIMEINSMSRSIFNYDDAYMEEAE